MDYIDTDDDLVEGQMKTVEADGQKILLARIAGWYHAVGGECPHAGAPLAEGVLRSGIVTCPWHKAAFCVATGTRTDPPAVDDLPQYTVEPCDGRLRIGLSKVCSDVPYMADLDDPGCMVIVGAGPAGAVAAQTLRRSNFSGRIVLIGQEDQLPYDRTVLSKYVLSGRTGGEKTPLQTATFYAEQRIERTTREVVAVDPEQRTVTFVDGGVLNYDSALIATGGIARPFTVPDHDLQGVYTLRSHDDAESIASAIRDAKCAVIVGAGFIGIEVAASLRERGLAVAVVAPQNTPLENQLGPEVGEVFQRVHEREGIIFHLCQEVVALEGDNGRIARVRLKSGAIVRADLVLVALGITPATDIIKGIDRCEDGGLNVDSRLKVIDGLYAAGDIATYPLYANGQRIRVEHWRVAQQHGGVAALNVIGRDTTYKAAPVFWTISFLKRLDYVGYSFDWDDVVVEGDLEKPEFLAFYVEGGKVAALAGWGRDKQMAAATTLLTERHDWTVRELREALQPFQNW